LLGGATSFKGFHDSTRFKDEEEEEEKDVQINTFYAYVHLCVTCEHISGNQPAMGPVIEVFSP
jgi:hypothetical protein